METDIEKRINELEARNAFQGLSSEVRKQQQEIGILKEKLAAAFDLLHKGNDIEDGNEKPPHY